MPVAGVRLGTPLALDGLSQSASAPLRRGFLLWRNAHVSNGMPTALVCKQCGEVFGVIFTPVTPTSTPMVAACGRCLNEVMAGKPATSEDEWREVRNKLGLGESG